MQYTEIKLTITPAEPWVDVFTSMMADLGCDSFMEGEQEGELLCYMPTKDYNEEAIQEVVENHEFLDVRVAWSAQEMPDRDWNQEWESNYTPVVIDGRCYVRAPFHPERPGMEFDIVIEPKMSFGTAKHATTYQMAEYVMETNLLNKSVLDMGSGTGVLAILAHICGAHPVTAIDNDEWAYRNCLENTARNHCEDIEVLLGDATLIGDHTFDVIFANINRNILMNDIPVYAKSLKEGGLLFISGFYNGKDLEILRRCCLENGMLYDSHRVMDNWAAAKFSKV